MKGELFADIILPLAVKGRFTYRVPSGMADRITNGSRVIVSFGNKKLYSGIVAEVHHRTTATGNIKEISELLDESPVTGLLQIRFWSWLSEYYMCTPGEIMKAALPSGLCLESETILRVNPEFTDLRSLDNPSLLLFNTVENKGKTILSSLPHEFDGRKTIRIVSELVLSKALITGQSIETKYKPREESYVILSRKFTDSELNMILDRLAKAPKQHDLLSAYLRITHYSSGSDLFPVKKSILLKEAGAPASSVNLLSRKNILEILNLATSRLEDVKDDREPLKELSLAQSEAYSSLKEQMKNRDIILLHGVTSSGKTELYIRLIDEQLKKGKQVLYLLPEIALTAQIIERLRRHFGSDTGVYHSRFSDSGKVEIWNSVADKKKGYKLILGARSALFLPFTNLGLIIVDEEHDGSYKQHDPAPRYHARDSAIMLSSFAGATTILGSATPSLESYHNAVAGKYGLTVLSERYGKINLPEIILANTREAAKKKLMVAHFTPQLLHAIDNALVKGEQVLLFRNRRGFSPYIECTECGWIPTCVQCAVNLTYHKEINRLVCHYCGTAAMIAVKCGNCGSVSMATRGFGTEKLEDEIRIVFPYARVARMDHDTTKNKNSFLKIISGFEQRQTDILIGTQMISKGLDFENLTVVGILDADNMLNFPDFRAHERAFQLMSQVSGRAGRRQKHGKVIIQTSDPDNRMIRYVVNHDYHGMYEAQTGERKIFGYPPYTRLVLITLKHKDRARLNEYSSALGEELRKIFGERVLGPEFPVISRIQLWYIKNIMIKIEKAKPLAWAKEMIGESVSKIEKLKGAASLRINIDVDPY